MPNRFAAIAFLRTLGSAAALCFLLAAASESLGQTSSDGDVLVFQSDDGSVFRENPFTTDLEGIRSSFVNLGLDPDLFEQFDYERGQTVMIGRSAAGTVQSTGGDDLRYENLILGGHQSDLVNDSVNTTGTLFGASAGRGVLRLEQTGTSFNNHTQLIPSQYQGSDPETLMFGTPGTFTANQGTSFEIDIDATRQTFRGFDAIIGLTGSGELYINTGARMEVEDAFIVGYAPALNDRVSKVEVDGPDSYLAAYGGLNPSNAAGPDRSAFAMNNGEIHQMIIGAYGRAEMRVTGGATVDAFYGAAIGVTRSDGDDEDTDNLDSEFETNGSGTVVVDGIGSSWNIAITAFDGDMAPGSLSQDGGALAIGEWDDTAVYDDDQRGSGHLYVSGGGVVNVTRYNDGSLPTDDAAVARIGKVSSLNLHGGRMNVMDGFINDGAILAHNDSDSLTLVGVESGGGGLLEVGTFHNREDGRLLVQDGQTVKTMIKTPFNQTFSVEVEGLEELLTAANFGLIEVTGDVARGRSEIEFDNPEIVPDTDFVSGATRNEALFYNAPAVALPMAEPAGQIVVEHSTIRFRPGLWNGGDLRFIGGDNIVDGRVINTTTGQVTVVSGAHVAFHDAVTNDGSITLSGDSNATVLGAGSHAGTSTELVTYHGVGDLNLLTSGEFHAAGNFALGAEFEPGAVSGTGGTLRLGVQNLANGSFAQLLIDGIGDLDFSTPANVEILGFSPPGGISSGDIFTFITATGGLDATNIALTALPSAPGFAFTPFTTATSFGLSAFIDLSIGGDLNGDGVVDAADIAIWNMFHGLEIGAAGANGDIDGDGDVDSTDFGFLLAQFGGPGVPLPASVAPEPAALMLLLSAGVFATRRRR